MKELWHQVRFFGGSCLLFMGDMIAFSLMDQYIIYGLLAFFCLYSSQHLSLARAIWLLSLLSLESFIFYGQLGLSLVYTIPILLIALIWVRSIYQHRALSYLLLVLAIIGQTCIVERFLLELPLSLTYTITRIFVNIIVLWLISLIYE